MYEKMLKDSKSKRQMLVKLFWSTFYLSAFTFGGGYVIITLMKKTFVDDYGWIEEDEMLDLVAIAQSSPGAIAVNGAIVIGYKLAGFVGILVSVLGTILPPMLIISVIALFYQQFIQNFWVKALLEGMQAGVAAVIAGVVLDMVADVWRRKQPILVIIMLAAFIANYFFSVNIIYIILSCIGLGLVYSWLQSRKGR
ncbi:MULTISPECIES: chromate transporter [Aerococcus]|uniref:chromate transporter n=1 Tax=Aerococcus TaxID=1375 RepID=UPI000200F87A|nr:MULTISPECIES: chromate transporter [Aerococcus]AEA01054.1 chromate transport protein [Aerococcus sp. Group 1]MCY3055804.1 chromate transporter [Aerococcus sp. Group 1]MCY3057535.1 chromate transporter [Aerococcus sp. Group 1]MCY3061566.1 chromate transporter [Aerococcus sp. Group 1]MDL5184149.1 chromate transporter [Aerococcus mictus]